MKTFQFYTLGKNELARIRVSKLKAKDFSEQADYNRISALALGDWLCSNLTTTSISSLIAHIYKRYKESENGRTRKNKEAT